MPDFGDRAQDAEEFFRALALARVLKRKRSPDPIPGPAAQDDDRPEGGAGESDGRPS